VRPDYAAAYGRLYTHHWWWRSREEIIVECLMRLSPPGGFGEILDVGCGDGLFFPRLRRFGRPQGVEMDETLVTPRDRRQDPIHIGPFDATFAPGVRFGLILMLDVIEHVADDVGAVRHAVGLLAPGGVVVITVPAFQPLWTAHDELNRHRVRYTRRTFGRVAKSAGLRIHDARYLFQWTVPVKLLVRAKERVLGAADAPPSIPARWVNNLLFRLTRLEAATYGRLPLPFGSSLLVVGAAR
jgi:SAM-dependent methyltransferase